MVVYELVSVQDKQSDIPGTFADHVDTQGCQYVGEIITPDPKFSRFVFVKVR